MTLSGDKTRSRPFRPNAYLALAAIVLSLGLSGCVQRRMLIRSEPSGALVYIDDHEIGTTPVAANFTYYGKRKIRLVKDGCETLTVMQDIPTPWYEYVPLDFVSENLVPGKIMDRRTLDYRLQTQIVVPTDQLLARGEDLRRGTHGSATVPIVPPSNPLPQPQPAVPNGYNSGPGTQLLTPPTMPQPTTLQPGAETIPTPSGVGGYPVHPLPQ